MPTTLVAPTVDPSMEGRFWSFVDVRDIDECWLWEGRQAGNGYGRFWADYANMGAHRLAYYFHHKAWPQNACVCHRCDTRLCCNPHHLFIGSVQENVTDKMRKGRWRSANQTGAHNGAAKLTEAGVIRMRAMMREGATNKALAEQFGVHYSAVSNIRRGKAWSHLGGPVTPKYKHRVEPVFPD